MALKIDTEFAKHYIDYRAKEDAAKTKKKLQREIKELEEESSSSSDDEYDAEYQKNFSAQCDSILQTLTNNPKSLNNIVDPMFENIVAKKTKTEKSEKPVYAKDLNREILVGGGIENENELMQIEKYSKLDSEDIINSNSKKNLDFKFDENESDDEDFLKTSKKKPMFIVNTDPCVDDEVELDIESEHETETPIVPTLTEIEINRDRKLKTARVSQTKTRAEKRKERKDNKDKQLKEKMKKLRAIKNKNLQEKLEKIKVNVPELSQYLTIEDIDDDFDMEEFSKKMTALYERDDANLPVDDEKPVFTDDSDDQLEQIDVDVYDSQDIPEDNTKEKKKLKKAKTELKQEMPTHMKKKAPYFTNLDLAEEKPKKKVGIVRKMDEQFDREKFPNFKSFLKKTFDICCEDLILGKDDEDDIKCRFKYRNVEKQTYGLDLEEIMLADDKELNKWASLKKITRIRSSADEEKDRRKYDRPTMQEKKKLVLTSLFKEESDEEQKEKPEEPNSEKEVAQISKNTKKRLRKLAKKKLLAESLVDEPVVQEKKLKKRPIEESETREPCKKFKPNDETTEIHEKKTKNQNERITDKTEGNESKKAKKKSKKGNPKEASEPSKKFKQNVETTEIHEKETKNLDERIPDKTEDNESKKAKKKSKNPKPSPASNKKKSKSSTKIPVFDSDRMKAMGINEGYYKHVLCKK